MRLKYKLQELLQKISLLLSKYIKESFENAQPHPHFDYEKKVFTKDGREEYMKELKESKNEKIYTVRVYIRLRESVSDAAGNAASQL